MQKKQIIERAKVYMDMLSNGIDPVSGNDVPLDNVLSQERLRKCFSFVSEILNEIIENCGVVAFPEDETDISYEVVRKKSAFSFNAIAKREIYISEAPISPATFVKNINAAVDTEAMEKLSITFLNTWLVEKGFLQESKMPATINKTVRSVTPIAEQAGIFEQITVDERTGEVTPKILLSKQAQEYILSCLKEA